MGLKQAYVPALTASADVLTRKTRELPLLGKALVQVGDSVTAEQAVLRAELPGELLILRIAEQLGYDVEDVEQGLKVKVGQSIEKGEIICSLTSFFGLFKAELKAPTSGVIEYYTATNAHIGIRQQSTPLEVKAYVDGKIVEIEESKAVVVETRGAFVQGIFGVGAEGFGNLLLLPVAPDQEVTVEILQALEINGCVLVGGARFSAQALRYCTEYEVKGVVCGSIDSDTLRSYVGHEIGVSITGDEDVPFALIITEGFGNLAISQRVLDILKPLSGKKCSISGVTQVRAGATRPEIIVPNASNLELKEPTNFLEVGARIRIIRVPNFGKFGTVTELPHDPQLIPSGAKLRVLKAKLEDGQEVIVPRANVELA
jgi:hypothetical protein